MAVKGAARKTLWSRAHNECAFPGCIQALTFDVAREDGGTSVKSSAKKLIFEHKAPEDLGTTRTTSMSMATRT